VSEDSKIQAPRSELHCGECGAVVELSADARTATCLYCASPQVVERPPSAARPNPSFVLPFTIQEEQARGFAQSWIRGSRWAKSDFRRASIEAIQGLYLPAYLYTAALDADFEAEIGEEYEVHTRKDGKTKTEVRVEWRSLRGGLSTWASDLLVTASRGLDNQSLESIEPYETHALRPYSPALVAGWNSEEPSLGPAEALPLARAEARAQLAQRLSLFMPGDKHRELGFQMDAQQEDLEPILLPVWVLPLRYGKEGRYVRLLVNGQSGKVAGKRPVSWVKVVSVILLGAALVSAALLQAERWGWFR